MRERAEVVFCLSAVVLAVFAGISTGPRSAAAADSAEAYVAAATATAGEDLKGVLSLCMPQGSAAAGPSHGPIPAEPAKVFDNLYFVGTHSLSAWALTTSAGIIIIDSLDNAQDAQTHIEGGLRKLKLDPTRIKYVIITHGHAGYLGGAQYLADKFRATLIMSDIDWDVLAATAQAPGANAARAAIPKRGRGVKDGETLTLGDTMIEFALTPLHTPGTLSLLFPLKDGELTHVGAEWGGTGFDFPPTVENFTTYIASAQKFSRIANERGADVPLANNPAFDEALQKIAALKSRKPDDPHPFVKGSGSEEKYLAVAAECAMAARARLRSPNP